MKDIIEYITANIGARLKSFCVWFYILECVAGIVGGIITFIWGSPTALLSLDLPLFWVDF